MRLNAPIPGANYLSDTRNYAWHRPPDIVDYDEAVSYLVDKIDEPEKKELVFAMLGIDAHITTIVTTILLQAVSKGKIGIDLAILCAGPLARYIEISAKDVDIKYEMGIEDKDRVAITPTLLKISLGMAIDDPEQQEAGDIPQEMVQEAANRGLMSMPQPSDMVASPEEQAAMLGEVTEEEPEDELS
jgi:hypothetical protein